MWERGSQTIDLIRKGLVERVLIQACCFFQRHVGGDRGRQAGGVGSDVNVLAVTSVSTLAFEEEHDRSQITLLNLSMKLGFCPVEESVFHVGEGLAKFRRPGEPVIEGLWRCSQLACRFGEAPVGFGVNGNNVLVPMNRKAGIFNQGVGRENALSMRRGVEILGKQGRGSDCLWCRAFMSRRFRHNLKLNE